MSNPVRILIVEDLISDFELARREIARVVKNYELHQVETEEAYLEALERLQPDLILSDYSLPSFDGRTALTLALEHAPFTPLIIWTGTANEDTAVDIMKAGATNYVIKENIKRLGPAVLHALEERDLRLKRKRGDTEREALFEIMKGLADTEDLSAFLKIIHSSIARVIDARNFMVIFYQGDPISYEAMYSVDQYDSPVLSAQLERSAAAYVCRREEPVLLTKTEFDALIDQDHIGLGGTRPECWLGAPLKTAHGIIGVIAVQNYENPNAYSEQDKQFLAGISSQVAVAVERRQAEEVVRESQRFAESTLNALTSHIAVLEENGTIIAVNRAWREFSALNGGDPTKTGPGVNYLAVCEAISALGTEGPLIAAAIRSVIRGDRKDYSLVYSCPSMFERRWFWVRVTAFETGGPVRIVLEHQNITERKEAELELRKSRARYQEIFDHSPVSLWEEDFSLVKEQVDILLKEGVIDFRSYFSTHPEKVEHFATLVRLVDANQAAMKLSGVEWKDDLLKSPSNPISNEATLNFQEELLGLMSPRMGFKMERIQRNAKGEQMQVLVSGRIPHGYEADWSKVIVSISDISDRKRMEDSLRDREQRLNAIIENEPECIKLLDSDGTVLQMNAAGLEMIEADDPEDVLGKPIYSIVTEEFRQEFQNLTEKVLRGESGKLQFEIVGLKGTRRWLDTHAVPMRNAEGEVFALLGITRNITEYKATEEALRASESKFKGFFDSAPDAMIIVNEDGQIILSNTQTEKMFGYSEEELSGRMIEVLVPERFRHKHPGHRGGYFANLRPREMGADLELFALHKNGSEFPVEISLNYHQTGKETIVLCAIRDITDRKNSERILRDSEERFQQMANHIQEIFWMTDAISGEELYVSPAAEAIWGHTPEMLMHNPGLFLRSVLPEDRSNVTQTITDQRNGIKTEVEYRIKGSDGSIRWVWDRAFPIIDESGKVSVVVGIAADISERKSSEKEVIRHLTELEALYENGLAVGRLLEPKDIGDRIIATFSKYLSWHHVAIRLKDPHSDELRLITFNREGLNEEAASDVKLRLESSLSKVGQGLSGWVVQRGQSFRSGSVHDHPQYFSTFPNIQSGLYMPLKIGDVSIGVISVESEEPNAFTEQDERLLATLASQAAVALENARLYEAVQQELSERVRAEEQLEQERNSLAQRVDRRTADLTRAMRELERAMRVKDEFLANMSHELRTPLNAILGLSESLAEQTAGPLNEKQQKYITTISESGYHLLSLINDILDLAKIEAGQVTLDINKVDLNSVCQSSLRMIKQMAQKKNQVVNLDIDPDVSLIWADERRLKQIIVNLLSNAVKYTPKDGSLGLEVRGDRGENKVRITAWDNGIGIKEQDLPLLFQPFVQLDSGFAREFSGTGLGLALVAQMARLHGGSVNVVSNFGEGSRFTLVLPWEPMLVADTVERMKSTGKYPAVINTGEHNRRTILLIEDTPEVVLVLTDYLEMHGYRIATANDGLAGISKAKSIYPDLILMDLQMPRMDGFETTRQLRREPDFEHIPIIALTSLAMSGDRERCLAAGMNEYISKPVNLKALVKIIRSYLPQQQQEESA